MEKHTLQATLIKHDITASLQLQTIHTFKCGSKLIRDLVTNNLFKVTEKSIKIGKFRRGKFHYNPTASIRLTN